MFLLLSMKTMFFWKKKMIFYEKKEGKRVSFGKKGYFTEKNVSKKVSFNLKCKTLKNQT